MFEEDARLIAEVRARGSYFFLFCLHATPHGRGRMVVLRNGNGAMTITMCTICNRAAKRVREKKSHRHVGIARRKYRKPCVSGFCRPHAVFIARIA